MIKMLRPICFSRTEKVQVRVSIMDGLLFVEGDFAISKTSQETTVLVEKFSEIPRVVFRVTAPVAPGLNEIVASSRTH